MTNPWKVPASIARRLFAAVLVAVTALLPACDRTREPDAPRSAANAGAPTTLRLGFRPRALADVTPVVIFEEQLQAEGLNVIPVKLSTPADAFNKLNAGEVDAIAGIPLTTVFKQFENGPPKTGFRAYCLQVDKAGEGWVSLVTPAGAVRDDDLSGLKGMTIGSLPTDQAVWLLKRILRAGGLQPQETEETVAGADVFISRYNPATPTLQLESGQQQGLFGLEPAIAKARSLGYEAAVRGPVSRFLYNGRPVPVSASMITDDFAKRHPDAFRAFLTLVDRAVQRIDAAPDIVRQHFTKRDYGGLSPEECRLLFMPIMVKPSKELRGITQRYIDDHRRDGMLEHEIPLDKLFSIDD